MTREALFLPKNRRPIIRSNKSRPYLCVPSDFKYAIGRRSYPSSGEQASPAEAYKAKTRGNRAESEQAAGTAHDIRTAVDMGIFPLFLRLKPIPRTKRLNRAKTRMHPTIPSPKTYWSAVK